MKIEIKSIWGSILFEYDCENNSLKKTLEEAIKSSANLSFADLRSADLRSADLRFADLRSADLRSANLSFADLRSANLRSADLRSADLSSANLSFADLRSADLRSADLRSADLRSANLSFADLRSADLRSADLRSANLSSANLSFADLRSANFNETTTFLNIVCPEEGSFIAYKKASEKIVKLEITEDAKRSSATSLKCRCSKAKVLEIQDLDGNKLDITEVQSSCDSSFIYKVGETIEVKNFDEDRWNECSTGIHFFINRSQAVKY